MESRFTLERRERKEGNRELNSVELERYGI